MLFGHLAVSALEHRYAKAEFVPIMAAAVFPDAVDKVAHYVLGRADSGRLWGHTLFSALLSTAIVFLIWGKRSGWSWALGYLSHLVCDIGSVVPWFYPFAAYEFPPSETFETTLWMSLTNYPRLALELLLSAWAVIALRPRLQTELQKLGLWPHGG